MAAGYPHPDKAFTTLTNNLIFLSRMDEEQIQLQTIDFPLSDPVSETAQSFLTLAKNGKGIQLTATNTTEGITKGNHDILFERFYRTDRSRNSNTSGYGLGFSIARAVVTAHKGKISAYSRDGETLTVDVFLPEHV